MKLTNAHDELHHWLGLLELDLRLGVDRRHLLATSRLCTLLIERLEKNPKLERYEFNCLSLRLLDLQRLIAGNAPSDKTAKPNPPARRAGKFRVISGGRTQTGSTRR